MRRAYGTLELGMGFLIPTIWLLVAEMFAGGENLSFLLPDIHPRHFLVEVEYADKVPIDHGNGVRLDRVEAIPGGLRWHLTLTDLSSLDVDPEVYKAEAMGLQIWAMCNDPKFSTMLLKEEGFFENVVRGNDGVWIATWRIDSTSCQHSL